MMSLSKALFLNVFVGHFCFYFDSREVTGNEGRERLGMTTKLTGDIHSVISLLGTPS